VLRTRRGRPVSLTPAQPVSTGVALTRPVSLGWRDPTTLAVLTRPAPRVGRVVLVPCDGATSLPAPRPRVDDFPGRARTLLASPGGPTALLLWDRQRRLHALDPQGSWDLDAVQPGLRAPTFVG
jgi:Lipoprotein LpqB beta-propeller domain